MRSRTLAPGVALMIAGLPLWGCTEVEAEEAEGYQPSKVAAVAGSELKRVTLTAEGAERTGLRTARVARAGRRRVVPYDSLIYDSEGRTWVYTSPKPLDFLRVPVALERVKGDRAVLGKGPAPGSTIVTTGAIEVYGSELEIGGE